MHATEMKTKRHYTSPVTQRATVELEGGFCASVVKEKPRSFIETTGHEINEISADDLGVGFNSTSTDATEWGKNGWE